MAGSRTDLRGTQSRPAVRRNHTRNELRMDELRPEEMEQIVGGAGTLPPIPSLVKSTLTDLMIKWKSQGYSLDRAVQAARSAVSSIYADEAEAYVRSIWDSI